MRINRIFIIFSVVILIAGGAYIYACQSPAFNVTRLTLRGNQKITEEEITNRIQPCLNKNILGLNVKRIEETLRQDLRIKRVKIKRRLPATLLIEVEEKRPVLWISLPAGLTRLGDSGFCGLSADQEIVPLDGEDLCRDLPLVTGIPVTAADSTSDGAPQPYRKWTDVRVQRALEAYRALTDIDPGAAELLSEINLSDISNPVLYLLPGIKVMMGQGYFERKWRRVRSILNQGKDVASWGCLDLRFDHQVLLTGCPSYRLSLATGQQTESSEKE